MTRIEFYSVEDPNNRPPFAHITKVVQRGYQKGQKIYIHTESIRQAEKIDEILWQQEANSFLPHQLVGEDENTRPPIEIGCSKPPTDHADILINLANEVPLFFSQFHWVFEYAFGDDDKKELARSRFKFYRERGYPLNHKKIRNE
ncbi:MAG: DNA polymerase III subunit chi [Enterobacterales bacterium]|nr:DNA polymerase III subunit chi [Enterobacterales bacterium]